MADSVEFKFDAKEWLDFTKRLQAKLSGPNSMKQFGGLISAVVYQDVMDHFENEQGPEGKWTPWSLSYAGAINGRIAFRKIRGRIIPLNEYQIEEWGIKPPRKPGKILQAAGNLRQRFTPNKWRFKSNEVIFFNNAKTKSGFPYAAAHDEGGPKLPQRKFMWLSDIGGKKMVTIVEKWLADT